MLGNGVGFDFDDLTPFGFNLTSIPGGLLILFNGGFVNDGSGTHRYMVILGEHPPIEIGGYVITHIHFCQVLVIRHQMLGNTDPLLESYSVIVISGPHEFRHPTISSICTNYYIYL